MKKKYHLLLFFSILVFLFSACEKDKEKTDEDVSLVKLTFVGREEGAKMLAAEDSYTRNLTRFDIEHLLGRKNGTREEAVQFITEQTLEWSEQEKTLLNATAERLNETITREGYKLHLPEKIRFVKSTMQEASGAGGYTRSDYLSLIHI